MKERLESAFDQIQADPALLEHTAAYLCREAQKGRLKSRASRGLGRLVAAAAAAIIILSYNICFVAVTHVSIDINPSLELSLNRLNRVIGEYAFNEEGARILSAVELRGKTLAKSADLLLAVMAQNGYVRPDALLAITVQTENTRREQALCSQVYQLAAEEQPKLAAGEIEVMAVSAQVWSDAHSHQMSPAKYLAMQELLELDQSAVWQEYSEASLSQIRQRIRECHGRQESPGGHGKSHGHNSYH